MGQRLSSSIGIVIKGSKCIIECSFEKSTLNRLLKRKKLYPASQTHTVTAHHSLFS